MATRVIDWTATVAAVQAVLDSKSPAQTQATLNSGVLVRNAVTSAGAVYDAQSNDGILNTSPYALSIQAWAASAQPAWIELDRVCRAVYLATLPAPPVALAAFGMSGVPPWSKGTLYTAGSNAGAAAPSVATGFNYTCSGTGTSGATEPTWPIVVGQSVASGGAHFQCVAPIVTGNAPAAIPWDITLQGPEFTLTAREIVAASLSVVNPGLATLLGNTAAISNAAIAARPASNPALDFAATSAVNALNLAIANANAWIAASQVT